MSSLPLSFGYVKRYNINFSAYNVQGLKDLLLSGVRAKWKKDRINSITLYTLQNLDYHPMFERLYFYENGRVQFVAGQSYPEELMILRDIFTGKTEDDYSWQR